MKNVTNNYASIISLLNTDLRLNAILKNTSTIGSVTWDGLNTRILKLNDIPHSSTIKVGDTVVTGGMSFISQKVFQSVKLSIMIKVLWKDIMKLMSKFLTIFLLYQTYTF
ncbi:MAG: hypothetical protein CM15mP102_17850 [Flavobacteriales bacterium]|nr:MAG: hypothetical protein CM15mP102_17850 [Flavobacteriales bacterium]